jgi:LysM repeat protein
MKYTVQQGDTLSKIARDVLGNMALWPAIAELNDLKNPDLIFPGQVLILPDKLEPVAEAPEANRQKAGIPAWLGWLLALSIGGGLVYANRHKLKAKAQKALATVKRKAKKK